MSAWAAEALRRRGRERTAAETEELRERLWAASFNLDTFQLSGKRFTTFERPEEKS